MAYLCLGVSSDMRDLNVAFLLAMTIISLASCKPVNDDVHLSCEPGPDSTYFRTGDGYKRTSLSFSEVRSVVKWGGSTPATVDKFLVRFQRGDFFYTLDRVSGELAVKDVQEGLGGALAPVHVIWICSEGEAKF